MDLEVNKTDLAVSLAKSLVGVTPYVGTAIGEIIGNIIPNQRIDRIAKFVTKLDEKIKGMEEEQLRVKLTEPGFIDIMEDAFFQAARALTDQRTEYIASFIKNGLSSEELEQVQLKKVLWLLGELNDVEILLLYGCYDRQRQDREFWSKHAELIGDRTVSEVSRTQAERDSREIHRSYYLRLENIGLLEPDRVWGFKSPDESVRWADIDQHTGKLESYGLKITSLGNLLLRYIDLIGD